MIQNLSVIIIGAGKYITVILKISVNEKFFAARYVVFLLEKVMFKYFTVIRMVFEERSYVL